VICVSACCPTHNLFVILVYVSLGLPVKEFCERSSSLIVLAYVVEPTVLEQTMSPPTVVVPVIVVPFVEFNNEF
jgi:hypothetical protein